MTAVLAEDVRTYRGESLEELLPQIREELGPNAVIVRQREGIVGGIGGFFGKKCLEVDAKSLDAPLPPPSVPASTVFDAYDTGDGELDVADESEHDAPEEHTRTLMDELIAQAAPFADVLSDAVARTEPEPELAFEPELDLELPVVAPQAHVPAPIVDDLRAALARALVPPAVADEILAEVDELRPFANGLTDTALARRALARRLRVRHRGRAKKRRIALIGAAGAGRSLAAAKLANVLARSGASICALALEPARAAAALGTATEDAGVALETADTPEILRLVAPRLGAYDHVIADVSATETRDPETLVRAKAFLKTLKPTETHLVVANRGDLDSTRLLVSELGTGARIDQLLVTHVDASGPCIAAGVSLWLDRPVSYLCDSPFAGSGIRPAEPDELARLALPEAQA